MNCDAARDLLPLHAYGDLTPAEASAVEVHLTACAGCRAAFAALGDVRRLLAATPVPAVDIDAGRLLAEAAKRQARRWRRLAFAGAAVAAGLLALVATRVEVRAGGGELAISWANPGRRAGGADPGDTPPHPRPDGRGSPEIDDKLRRLDELARTLAAEIDERDARRVGEIANLRARLDAVQRLSAERWAESRRDFDALYTAQFRPAPKGDVP